MAHPVGQIKIRSIAPTDAKAAAQLVAGVFSQDVGPSYRAEGVAEFLGYASPEAFAARLAKGHVGFVAEDERGELVGVVEVRDLCHVSLLFVSGAQQRQGIGKALISQAVAACRRGNQATTTVTVNASPNSVAAYERYGFRASGPEQERDGIRFVPMVLAIDALGSA
jgi:GNAT superfamily N-acetyltransferase